VCVFYVLLYMDQVPEINK